MSNKIQFKSRKEVTEYLKTKGIDTSNWSEVKWLSINKGQADIHMMAVAEAIYDAWNEADFKKLNPGEWHIPFGDQIDLSHSSLDVYKSDTGLTSEELTLLKVKIAIARCARLSYQTLGDDPKIDYLADLKLYNDLRGDRHWSPFEHVAKVMNEDEYMICAKTIINKEGFFEQHYGWLANFRGWIQQRCLLENAI